MSKKTPRKIIQDFMKRHGCETGGCRTFYTPKEWKEKGGEYGLTSKLVVVYDGGDLYSTINHEFGFTLSDELTKDLAEHGYYFEPCTSWYCAIYDE